MTNFINWFTRSSADPEKTSLALKGTLALIASYVLTIAPYVCSFAAFCFDTGIIAPAIDLVVKIVEGVLVVGGSATTLYGLIRKIYLGRWAAPSYSQN